MTSPTEAETEVPSHLLTRNFLVLGVWTDLGHGAVQDFPLHQVSHMGLVSSEGLSREPTRNQMAKPQLCGDQAAIVPQTKNRVARIRLTSAEYHYCQHLQDRVYSCRVVLVEGGSTDDIRLKSQE